MSIKINDDFMAAEIDGSVDRLAARYGDDPFVIGWRQELR